MEEKSKVYILNPRRVAEVNFAVLALQRGLNVMDCDAQVTWGHSKVCPETGYVTIEGPELILGDPKNLSRAIAIADNIDIYPLENGNLRLTLTFHRYMATLPTKNNDFGG